MTPSLICGLALFLNAGAAAGPTPCPEPALVQALVRQLDDPRFSARQEAEHKLLQLGVDVVPQLRQQLQARPPLEVYRRLEGIIDALANVPWHHDLDEAKREAGRTGKLILVLSTLGKADGTGSLASQALRSRTFSDLQLVAYLKRNFVVVWHDQAAAPCPDLFFPDGFTAPQFGPEQVATYAEGRGAEVLHSYFCTPQGNVLYGLQGFWNKDRYRAEADFARSIAAETHGVAAELRAVSRRHILTERGAALSRERQGFGADALWAETLERSLLSNQVVDQPIGTVVDDLAKRSQQFSYG